MSLHTLRRRKPSSCTTLTLNCHWGRAATGKKISCIYARKVTSIVSNCFRPCSLWPARLLCQGGSSGKNTAVYWPILVAIPSGALYFLLPYPLTPLSNWCYQNPATQRAASPPHLALTMANPSPPGQPQEQTPVDDPHAEVEIKPQLKLRGSVAGKKTQHLPTSCTSCRLNPHNKLGRLCVYGIHKRTLRPPTKENALVLIAVDTGGKNTQE